MGSEWGGWGLLDYSVSGFRAQGLGVWGFRFRGSGLGFRGFLPKLLKLPAAVASPPLQIESSLRMPEP